MTPVARVSRYNPTNTLDGTWVECESFAYPVGGFTRRAYVELRRNPHNPIVLPYGERRIVLCSIPDTFYSIPARLRIGGRVTKGRTVKGFVSVATLPPDMVARFTFTPLSGASTHIDNPLCSCDACKARKKRK